ncbi:hypothetical protein NFI96_026673 [Prochilodus magdalenae]|nr:hypothetical protein NFI96_026673 [Prochilodus magdalenae]
MERYFLLSCKETDAHWLHDWNEMVSCLTGMKSRRCSVWDGSAHFSETKGVVQRSRPAGVPNRQDRKLQRYRAQRLASYLQGDEPNELENLSGLEKLNLSPLTERPCSYKSFISQVPLRLLIKVSGQRGGLGISIAGGKGSLPYKENDEGIFISRVSKGGPAEKAGVHIGDRVLEVNGQDMCEVSHHEAVSALRSAGSCIKMKVLRERPPPPESRTSQEQDITEVEPLMISHQWIEACPESTLDRSALVKRIEAVVCNGKGLGDLSQDIRPGKDRESMLKTSTLQAGKHTMTIPRIILTHPSTSDEDVEPLTHGTDSGDFDDLDDPDDHIYSDLNCAFYPP